MRKSKPERPRAAGRIGKRVLFDRATWNAVDLLARDQMKDLEEIAEEAFTDLLRKHGRSADLKEALRLSSGGAAGLEKRQRKATELAGETIDRLADKSAPADEQDRRKGRLLKGPPELRLVRNDPPRTKK